MLASTSMLAMRRGCINCLSLRQVLKGHEPVDEAAAARLFAAMAKHAGSSPDSDSASAADLSTALAKLSIGYPPEVCFHCSHAFPILFPAIMRPHSACMMSSQPISCCTWGSGAWASTG